MRILMLAAIAAGTLLAGCGPIWSAAVIADASGKFRAAAANDAKQYSPYEYYAAEEYLHKAREKESYAQYERAVDYGKLALGYAKAALERSQHAKAGMTPAAPHPALQSIFQNQPAQRPAQPRPSQPQYGYPPPAQPAPAPQGYPPPAQPQYGYPPPAPQPVPPAPQQPTF